MSTTGELRTRTQAWLMDEAATGVPQAFLAAQVREQLAHSGARLAAQRLLGAVVPVQAVASRHYYPLDEQAILITSGTATGGSTTTLVDSGKNFVTLGVTANRDRVRNLTDGSSAIVSTVATTTLTVPAWSGGVNNITASGNAYLVETPLSQRRVVDIAAVYYNGGRLLRTTEQELDAKNDGWETAAAGTPRYWLTDSLVRPTELRVSPAPSVTGSGAMAIPPVPFTLSVTNNLLVFLWLDVPDLTADETTHGFPHAYEDLLVLNAAHGLTTRITEYEYVALGQVLPVLASGWQEALGGGV